MSAHTQHFTVRELKAPSNVSNWPQTWKFSLFLLHMTVFKNSTVQIFRPTILQLMSKLCSLCLILDGPLEKWLGEGEGGWGWDFVSLQDFFYMSTTLAKSFFWGGGGIKATAQCFLGWWAGWIFYCYYPYLQLPQYDCLEQAWNKYCFFIFHIVILLSN